MNSPNKITNIIVLDHAKLCIDIIKVPNQLLEDDIEIFLVEHNYSLDNISWMEIPGENIPTRLLEYKINPISKKESYVTCNEDLGNLFHNNK